MLDKSSITAKATSVYHVGMPVFEGQITDQVLVPEDLLMRGSTFTADKSAKSCVGVSSPLLRAINAN